MPEWFAEDTLPTASAELDRFKTKLSETDRLARGFTSTFSKGLVDLAVKGRSFGDVLQGMALSLSRLALRQAMKPLEDSVTQGLNGLMGNLLGRQGTGSGGGLFDGLAGLFSPRWEATGPPMSIVPFANGGVIGSPTYFPLGAGLGLAGEAGAEAILPLQRGSDGALGVRAAGGANGPPVNVTFNIQTPDTEGFRRSEAEISARLARVVGRGRRAG